VLAVAATLATAPADIGGTRKLRRRQGGPENEKWGRVAVCGEVGGASGLNPGALSYFLSGFLFCFYALCLIWSLDLRTWEGGEDERVAWCLPNARWERRLVAVEHAGRCIVFLKNVVRSKKKKKKKKPN
jgi:hypothetical protein